VTAANVTNSVANPVDVVTARTFAPGRALKRVYKAVRNLYDRLVHPNRHLAACRRLLNSRGPRRILVVCHGNICRSPYLEAVLQRGLPDVVVTSAGFVGSDRPVPANSVALSAERGIDLTRHRSRPITQANASEADLVIVMDPEQARRVGKMFGVERERIIIAGDLEPKFQGSRDIRDPWNEAIEVFRSSFDRLDRCAATVIGVLPPSQRQSR